MVFAIAPERLFVQPLECRFVGVGLAIRAAAADDRGEPAMEDRPPQLLLEPPRALGRVRDAGEDLRLDEHTMQAEAPREPHPAIELGVGRTGFGRCDLAVHAFALEARPARIAEAACGLRSLLAEVFFKPSGASA